MPDPQKISEKGGWLWVGRIKDLVVIVRRNQKPKINIDGRFGFHSEDERSDRGQVRKIVNFALQQENIDPQQCEVSILWAIGAQRFGKEMDINFGNSSGGSGGSAIYLALLSVLHQKPISGKVAATGTLIMSEQKGMVNGQEIILAPGTNLPITGLKEKTMACVEKGINKLVISKYQSSPNLLTKKDENNPNTELKFDDYQQVVSPEIKEKIQVY